MKFSKFLRKKSEGDSDEIFEDEARHIRKVVLCVLLEEWRAVLGNIAEDSRITLVTKLMLPIIVKAKDAEDSRISIRRMLGGFSAP